MFVYVIGVGIALRPSKVQSERVNVVDGLGPRLTI